MRAVGRSSSELDLQRPFVVVGRMVEGLAPIQEVNLTSVVVNAVSDEVVLAELVPTPARRRGVSFLQVRLGVSTFGRSPSQVRRKCQAFGQGRHPKV